MALIVRMREKRGSSMQCTSAPASFCDKHNDSLSLSVPIKVIKRSRQPCRMLVKTVQVPDSTGQLFFLLFGLTFYLILYFVLQLVVVDIGTSNIGTSVVAIRATQVLTLKEGLGSRAHAAILDDPPSAYFYYSCLLHYLIYTFLLVPIKGLINT